jgi:hypothetical protein
MPRSAIAEALFHDTASNTRLPVVPLLPLVVADGGGVVGVAVAEVRAVRLILVGAPVPFVTW